MKSIFISCLVVFAIFISTTLCSADEEKGHICFNTVDADKDRKVSFEEFAEYFGKGGRIKTSAAKELIKSAYTFECNEQKKFFHEIGLADIAHVLMLIEEEIIPLKEGKILIEKNLPSLINTLTEKGFSVNQMECQLKKEHTVRHSLIQEIIGEQGCSVSLVV